MKKQCWVTVVLGLLLLAGCRKAQAWSADNNAAEWVKASPTVSVAATAVMTASPSAAPATATAQPSPTPPRCTDSNGRVEAFEITAAGFSEPLAFSVYLPPCYAENEPEDGYPYVILLHGQTYTEQQWMDLGLPQVMDRLVTAGDIPPYVVVMPFESPAYYNLYNIALTRDLLPWLVDNLAVCDDFACRGIGGISRGGGWALYTLFQEPGIFSSLGLHSTPAFDNTPYYIRRAIQEMTDDQYPRIYMDIGANDYWYPYAWNVKVFFDENSIAHEWHEYEGKHEDAYWAAHLEEYLRWYGMGWQE
ncbi:MAG: hypothetical protein HPY85_00425 [Anaerolineae bacterium]|nr:hypothetical protein [Anaerolineae bacterium]